jgi:hydroxymethylpyrimidine pyrophosphatase-like HAD family hydrolase
MSKIKLLALDLDGTLLTHDKQISLKIELPLNKHKQQVFMSITTGRPLKAIEHI